MNCCLKLRLKNSVKLDENGKAEIYLADRRIINKEGTFIGFFDTEHSLNTNRVIHHDEEEFVSVNDFKDEKDFLEKIDEIKKILKFKEEDYDG